MTSIRFDADAIIDGVPEALLAAQISFRCFDADMAEQKLNLLQLPADRVADPNERDGN
jgi:hypothetical protein